MTVYLSLMLGVMIPLFLASVFAVKVAAGRMQTANALDQAMFSLLGHYDRDLMERYDLFFVDGGYGTAELHHEQTCDFLEEAMSYIFSPGKGRLTGGSNLLSLSSESMSITGYTLATDQDGGVFALQAEMAAKETLLTDGLGTLSEGVQSLLSDSQQAEQRANGAEGGLPSEGYAGVKAQAEAAREEAAGSASSGAESGTGGSSDGGQGTPSQVVNPLESIETLRKSSLMNLVCPDAGNISQNTVSAGQLLSGRGKSSGMGVISLGESPYSTGNALYLNRYIMTHFGYYTSPEEGNGLKYPLEQIIKGRNSDQANLEAVAKQLLLIREGVNLAAIYGDGVLSGQMAACAAGIAAVLMAPALEPVIQALLSAGWAYCESLLDVRSLLNGDKVGVIKNSSNWQVSLENIPVMLTDMDAVRRPVAAGIDYKDYLSAFLLAENTSKKISGAMDMIEHEIRANDRDSFRLDHCFDSLSVETQVISEKIVSLKAEKTLCYRDLS